MMKTLAAGKVQAASVTHVLMVVGGPTLRSFLFCPYLSVHELVISLPHHHTRMPGEEVSTHR